ncbi:carboxy terminal-processing peptidase [Pedobacter borealis]|uniref:carboxy terminal-processing peptidase n=1 Tax=Pedobacter borealis TaxID=475254 RepID=UPI0009F84A56|nr:carboxy terminal-processing peptidase [Pedobacter borealis]
MKYIISVLLLTIFIRCDTVDAQTRKELVRFDSIVHMSSRIVKTNHYAYSSFDDTFSKKLFTTYVEALDKWHAVFLQKDVEELKKYETSLDDELNGAKVRFFAEAERLYRKRLKESAIIITQLLSKPLDLNRQDQFLSTAPATFPVTKEEQLERWQQWLTWETEVEMYSLKEEREQKGITSTVAELEGEARVAVKKKMTGLWYCLLNKMDHEYYLSWYMGLFCLAMDPHSMYFDAVGEELYANLMGGTISGIGVVTDQHHGLIRIVELEPDGSAQLSGKMAVGDFILTVKQANGNPEDIAGYTKGFLKRIFEGANGTELTLRCKRADGSTYSVTLKRTITKVTTALVKSAVIEKNTQKIGYILLPQFYAGKTADVGHDMAQAVQLLNAEKVSSIIIDLRNNRGGDLDGCIKSLSEFLPQGPVIQAKRKKSAVEVYNTNTADMNFKGPLVLLANQHTISCGDLFTLAMQDYGRGLVMGSPTSGKGTGNYMFKVEENQSWKQEVSAKRKENFGELTLTVMKYYSVTGRSIQQKGVTPDVTLPETRYDDSEIEFAQKNALHRDSIAPINYTAWNFGFDLESAKKNMQAQVSNNAIYKQIAENEAWLKKADKEPVSLNWTTYSFFRKEMGTRFNQSLELEKLKTKLSVRVLGEGSAKAQEEFLNKINTDLHISTAADAALEIIKVSL